MKLYINYLKSLLIDLNRSWNYMSRLAEEVSFSLIKILG